MSDKTEKVKIIFKSGAETTVEMTQSDFREGAEHLGSAYNCTDDHCTWVVNYVEVAYMEILKDKMGPREKGC
jgi:hypothetical protein